MKFTSVTQLRRKVNAYFAECDPHIIDIEKVVNIEDKDTGDIIDQVVVVRKEMSKQVPYTITGLALALGTTRNTLVDYENPDHYDEEMEQDFIEEIIRTIKEAKEKCHNFAELSLYTGSATGPIFNLKNNYGWIDESKVDNTIRDVSDDLDDLESDKEDFDKNVKEAYARQGGQEAKEQVVEAEQSIQDQGQERPDNNIPAEPDPAEAPSPEGE